MTDVQGQDYDTLKAAGWFKKYPSPQKKTVIFSLTVNLRNWKFSHIFTRLLILVHLSKYLYDMCHFY